MRNWIKLNEHIMERVQKGGRAYLSNATVNGHFALRACITNFRTTKTDIDETVAAIREAAEVSRKGAKAQSKTQRFDFAPLRALCAFA